MGRSTGVDVTLASAQQATFYTLTNGERPMKGAAWTLEARSGNGGWQTLDTRSGEAFEWSLQLRPFRIAKPGRYDQYRLRFTAPGRMQLAEVELLAPSTPVPVKES
jgi:hypothetical protein